MVSVKVLVLLVATVLAADALSSPYLDEDESDQQQQPNGAAAAESDLTAYFDSDAADVLMDSAQKRSCIRRGGSCDHRRNDCCFSSSCRCNLWGSNCRCQRAGLFQKWG